MKKLLKKLFIPEVDPKARIVSLWFQMIVTCIILWVSFFSIASAIIFWFVYLLCWATLLYDQWLEAERAKMNDNLPGAK